MGVNEGCKMHISWAISNDRTAAPPCYKLCVLLISPKPNKDVQGAAQIGRIAAVGLMFQAQGEGANSRECFWQTPCDLRHILIGTLHDPCTSAVAKRTQI